MSIRSFGHWVCLLAIAFTGAAAVASCGNSSPISVFDAGIDHSLGNESPLPPSGDDAGPPVDLDAFGGCKSKVCSDLGYNCGMNGDGCGGLLDCGGCPSGQFCGGAGYSKCGTGMGGDGGPNGGCARLTCQALHVNCGKQGDGCGGVLDCGGCPAGQFCGGGGFNLCGFGMASDGAQVMSCQALTCAGKGWDCGQNGDGCGATITCGNGATCPGNEYCGGGGYNKCGGMKPPVLPDGAPGLACTPQTCTSQGFNCGPAGDGCGNLIPTCGSCSGSDIWAVAARPASAATRLPARGFASSKHSATAGRRPP
jgi:hypothetical protein